MHFIYIYTLFKILYFEAVLYWGEGGVIRASSDRTRDNILKLKGN